MKGIGGLPDLSIQVRRDTFQAITLSHSIIKSKLLGIKLMSICCSNVRIIICSYWLHYTCSFIYFTNVSQNGHQDDFS